MTRAGCHRTILWFLSNGGGGMGGGMGGGIDCGAHLEIYEDIHNTDFCRVIECYIFDAK